jgi:hypothetical protein
MGNRIKTPQIPLTNHHDRSLRTFAFFAPLR